VRGGSIELRLLMEVGTSELRELGASRELPLGISISRDIRLESKLFNMG
jgi:hypothetical protein